MNHRRQNWTEIFSTFRVAFGARKIILGTVGVLMSALVILALLWVAGKRNPEARETMMQLVRDPFMYARDFSRDMTEATTWSKRGDVLRWYVSSARDFAERLTGHHLALIGGGLVLLLFIWSYLGGAIARLAAVDFARQERLPLGEATAFSARKIGSFFWSPIVPLIFVVLLILCNALLGWLGHVVPVVGPLIVGFGLPLAALSAFLALILIIGTVFGFPFMWPTIAMEGTDSFDAISRGFNYLFARPWKTIWCWLVTLAYAIPVFLFVMFFTCALLRIMDGAVAWGMGADWNYIAQFMTDGRADAGAGIPMKMAMVLVCLVHVLIWAMVFGFWASFKISALTIIYSVLRRDVDGTDMNEVFLPEVEETLTPVTASTGGAEKPEEPKPQA